MPRCHPLAGFKRSSKVPASKGNGSASSVPLAISYMPVNSRHNSTWITCRLQRLIPLIIVFFLCSVFWVPLNDVSHPSYFFAFHFSEWKRKPSPQRFQPFLSWPWRWWYFAGFSMSWYQYVVLRLSVFQHIVTTLQFPSTTLENTPVTSMNCLRIWSVLSASLQKSLHVLAQWLPIRSTLGAGKVQLMSPSIFNGQWSWVFQVRSSFVRPVNRVPDCDVVRVFIILLGRYSFYIAVCLFPLHISYLC